MALVLLFATVASGARNRIMWRKLKKNIFWSNSDRKYDERWSSYYDHTWILALEPKQSLNNLERFISMLFTCLSTVGNAVVLVAQLPKTILTLRTHSSVQTLYHLESKTLRFHNVKHSFVSLSDGTLLQSLQAEWCIQLENVRRFHVFSPKITLQKVSLQA